MLRLIKIQISAFSLFIGSCLSLDLSADSGKPLAGLSDKPNIIVIVADDLGYSDIQAFGGEIDTPNLSALAIQGILLSNFYASPACSPTRAMLLSGVDNHLAGLGNMREAMAENQKGKPGYEGYLNFRVATLAEVLKDAGYRTYMTGKWHLGHDESTSPAARGFEQSFASLDGGAGHFDLLPMVGPGIAQYRENDKLVNELPEDFYSSRFFTRKLIEYINSDRNDERPFFAYLAFTSPHWPLQAPQKSIAKYHGRYDAGYRTIHEQRLERQKQLGLISENIEPFTGPEDSDWNELSVEEKKYEARKMEVYAAMISDMDTYIGELIAYLKESGDYDNTFILFLSDNGAAGGNISDNVPPVGNWIKQCCDNSYENLGKQNSFVWTGPNWAWVSSVPYRMYKGFASEGGIKVPAIIHFPKWETKGKVFKGLLTVKDVMPTLLELAGSGHPAPVFKGRDVLSMSGKSFLTILQSDETSRVETADDVYGWELFGRRAIRQGQWKLLSQKDYTGENDWRLYDLSKDPGELHSLSRNEPEKLQEMLLHWNKYAEDNKVVMPGY